MATEGTVATESLPTGSTTTDVINESSTSAVNIQSASHGKNETVLLDVEEDEDEEEYDEVVDEHQDVEVNEDEQDINDEDEDDDDDETEEPPSSNASLFYNRTQNLMSDVSLTNQNSSNEQVTNTRPPNSAADGTSEPEIPDGVDPSFLAALPQEMRDEVIAEHIR